MHALLAAGNAWILRRTIDFRRPLVGIVFRYAGGQFFVRTIKFPSAQRRIAKGVVGNDF